MAMRKLGNMIRNYENIFPTLASALEQMRQRIETAEIHGNGPFEVHLFADTEKEYAINRDAVIVREWDPTIANCKAEESYHTPSAFVKEYVKTPELAMKISKELLSHKDSIC